MVKRLSEHFKGRQVVLYFYPRDNTPGCTTQACSFRDHISTIEDKGAIVLGVSRDSLKSHQKFIEKFNLPFLLLSDENEEVCKRYDVMKEKNMYGKKVMGIERSTFIIDEDGKIKIFRKVKWTTHGRSAVLDIYKLYNRMIGHTGCSIVLILRTRGSNCQKNLRQYSTILINLVTIVAKYVFRFSVDLLLDVMQFIKVVISVPIYLFLNIIKVKYR